MGSPNDNCSRQRSVDLQQLSAGEQCVRLSVPNCDPVSLTLAKFMAFLWMFALGPVLAKCPLTRMSTPQS